MGGNNGTAYVGTVYTAPINSDGTLGAWTTSTPLPGALSNSTTVVTKNYVYLISGYNTSAVYYAPINPDGTLGTWATGNSLPAALHGCTVFVTKNRVYVVGGATTTATVSSIYSAQINMNGLLGGWNTESSFPVNIYNANVYINKNIVYIITGSNTNSSTTTNSVYRSYIKDDGTIGPWILGTNFPVSICTSSLIATKNRIYVMGGYFGTTGGATSNVYSVSISGGLNDYSAYYDGSIIPAEPINPSTLFKLPDMSATDVNGIYHYIKF